jgi:acyl-CoA thioester hydrolase
MSGASAPPCTQIRVCFADTDAAGVVYHAVYLRYFEIARAEMFRSMGVPFTAFSARNLVLAVAGITCRFHKPARYDDVLALFCRLVEVGAVTTSIDCEARLPDGELCVSCETRLACVEMGSFRPRPIPRGIVLRMRAVLEGTVGGSGGGDPGEQLPPR